MKTFSISCNFWFRKTNKSLLLLLWRCVHHVQSKWMLFNLVFYNVNKVTTFSRLNFLFPAYKFSDLKNWFAKCDMELNTGGIKNESNFTSKSLFWFSYVEFFSEYLLRTLLDLQVSSSSSNLHLIFLSLYLSKLYITKHLL